MDTVNVYDDSERAKAYARLGFPGTYYLAFRDIPALMQKHICGNRALDFGCGAGRSSRFLRSMGFDVMGIDSSAHMVSEAMAIEPSGEYRVIPDNDLSRIEDASFDLILSAFTFDNVPSFDLKVRLMRQLGNKLNENGKIVNVVSTPEIYVHEWVSFTTRPFPENKTVKSGEQVRIIITEMKDARPVVDFLCSDEDYREIFRQSNLQVIESHRPLGRDDEPFSWVNETTVPPWCIYISGK